MIHLGDFLFGSLTNVSKKVIENVSNVFGVIDGLFVNYNGGYTVEPVSSGHPRGMAK